MDNTIKLVVLKLVHTLIWIVFVTVIMYVLYAGLANRITTYTWVAVGLVILEGLILLLFKGRCPLTLIARRYSNSSKDNFDIFLPNWLARYNKLLFSSLFIAGLIVVGYRLFY